ncbi:hypothetical protein [Mycobacterium sp. DL440]|uniref:hypothetical protein n=1 Tax=Mycobacterium sp. DL440 TaxID=2675523 RepID=UPI0014207CB2|nr:hypothetical protein [Mycobacterium sp. DL440]
MTDTRVTRAISLLLTGDSRLVEEACELMEALCDELPAPHRPRLVWCPHDARQAARAAAQHRGERGLRLVSGGAE